MTPLVVYDPAYQSYNFGPEHPFSPLRLSMLTDLLEALGVLPAFVAPPSATRADVMKLHSETLVTQVEAASCGVPYPDARRYGLDTPDVPTFVGMDEATRILVGGTLHAAHLVASGQARRVLQLGGGLHHAQRERASGFCIYNDVALAVGHLRDQGLRVAYIDIDVHHGDGVQWLHYDDPGVLTISLHESGRYLFPGTGDIHELGRDEGQGFKLNVPLAPFTQDAGYLEAFEDVTPLALSRFAPDVLVADCGADAHATDPLAHLLLTTNAYETLFRRLLALADEHTDGRIVLTLGGGYDFDATARVWTMLALLVLEQELPERLPKAWLNAWGRRLDRSLTPTLHDTALTFSIPRQKTIEEENRQITRKLLALASPHWD